MRRARSSPPSRGSDRIFDADPRRDALSEGDIDLDQDPRVFDPGLHAEHKQRFLRELQVVAKRQIWFSSGKAFAKPGAVVPKKEAAASGGSVRGGERRTEVGNMQLASSQQYHAQGSATQTDMVDQHRRIQRLKESFRQHLEWQRQADPQRALRIALDYINPPTSESVLGTSCSNDPSLSVLLGVRGESSRGDFENEVGTEDVTPSLGAEAMHNTMRLCRSW